MAACGSSLRHLFQRPRPENPTLMESLSWSQINAAQESSAAAAASFTEIFGELHFDERRSAAACPAQPAPPAASDRCPPLPGTGSPQDQDACGEGQDVVRSSHPSSASPMGSGGGEGKISAPGENGVVPRTRRSEALRLCTEGLGSESSDDAVDDPKGAGPGGASWIGRGAGGAAATRQRRYSRALSVSGREFPPPISCIGSGGRPWVSFRSYREGGRFVLREVKIPGQELLTASREGGRLKLRFDVHRDEAAAEEEEDDEEAGAEEEEEEEDMALDETGDAAQARGREVAMVEGHGV